MLKNWNLLRRTAAAALLATAVFAAQAFTLIPVRFEEMARDAELVVLGRVSAVEARYNDARTMILTHTRVEIDEVVAGEAPPALEIAEYGGRVGDRAMVSPAQVIYREGERVLVFVCRDALDLRRTCGAHQGRMEVRPAADGSFEAVGLMAGEIVRGSLPQIRARVLDARERSR
jgi:hypothetical protein